MLLLQHIITFIVFWSSYLQYYLWSWHQFVLVYWYFTVFLHSQTCILYYQYCFHHIQTTYTISKFTIDSNELLLSALWPWFYTSYVYRKVQRTHKTKGTLCCWKIQVEVGGWGTLMKEGEICVHAGMWLAPPLSPWDYLLLKAAHPEQHLDMGLICPAVGDDLVRASQGKLMLRQFPSCLGWPVMAQHTISHHH